MRLGERARLLVGVGDDHVARERPLGDRLRAPGRRAVLEELLLALEEAPEVGRRSRDPVIGERGGAPQRDVAPATDPEGRVGLLHRRGLEAPLDRVIGALEAHTLPGPEPLHDRHLLLEARAALLERDAVEGELVGLVADRDAERDAAARHHVEHRDVLGEPHRVVERADGDVGAERDARRARREAGEHGERRGPVVVGDRVVLLHPDGVEAQGLGPRDLLERLLVVVAALDGNEAELQPRHGAMLPHLRASARAVTR